MPQLRLQAGQLHSQAVAGLLRLRQLAVQRRHLRADRTLMSCKGEAAGVGWCSPRHQDQDLCLVVQRSRAERAAAGRFTALQRCPAACQQLANAQA